MSAQSTGTLERVPGRDDLHLERGPQGPATTDTVLPGTRRVFGTFTALTLLAATTLVLLAGRTERYFAWTITAEPTAAFYGAAYAAGHLLSVLALRERRWSHVRVALSTVNVFSVLTLLATLIHLHLLHLTSPDPVARFAAWFWLGVYVVIPAAGTYAVIRQRRLRPTPGLVRRPIPGWLAVLLAGQGLLLLTVGAVLFLKGAAVHHFPASAAAFWPWPVGPLGAQIAGAWLVALGVATGLVLRERDLDRLRVPAATYAAFGAFQLLVAVRYREEVRPDDQWAWAYIAVLVAITLTGAYGFWRAGRGRLGA
jgi:hypothetical protein